MTNWPRHLSLMAFMLPGAFQAIGQLPMPDKVCVGASKSYWVDSTANPGSAYIWAINGNIVKSGRECAFIHTWKDEGIFGLTLRKVTAEGCESEMHTGEVIVKLQAGIPEFTRGPFSSRITAAETMVYTATTGNSSGIRYSLDTASLLGGSTINPETGEVTFPAAWAGTTVITALAEGCSGPLFSTHMVTTSSPGLNVRIFPNPLSGAEVCFQIILPILSHATVDLFSDNGQLVSRLFEGNIEGGATETIRYRNFLPQGIYLYQIKIDNQVINGRLIVIRAY